MKESNQIKKILGKLIEKSVDQDRIEPSWIANAARKRIDREEVSPPLMTFLALLSLKQFARDLLRRRYESDEDIEQHKMFPGLQAKYPVARKANEEPVYVKLEYLSAKDIKWNVQHLRSESKAKAKHADALEAWAITNHVLAA